MIVVEERQRHVGAVTRKRFDRPIIDRRVVQALKNQGGLVEARIEGVVLQAVLVKRVIELPLRLLTVMKKRECTALPPLVDAFWRQQVVATLCKHDSRCEQNEAIDAVRKSRCRQNCEG